RRKGEVGRRAFLLGDNHSKLIDDVVFVDAFEHWTHESVRHHMRSVARKELRNPGDAMTDDVVQELAGQPAYPVLLVAKERAPVPRLTEVVTVVAFHVRRRSAEITVSDELPHAPRDMGELVVMASRQLQPLFVGESDE